MRTIYRQSRRVPGPGEIAISDGVEGIRRADRFLDRNPEDPAWSIEKVYLLCSLASAYRNSETPEKAATYIEQADDMADSLMRRTLPISNSFWLSRTWISPFLVPV